MPGPARATPGRLRPARSRRGAGLDVPRHRGRSSFADGASPPLDVGAGRDADRTGPAGPRSCAGPRTSPPTTAPSPPSGTGRDRAAGRAARRRSPVTLVDRRRRRRRRTTTTTVASGTDDLVQELRFSRVERAAPTRTSPPAPTTSWPSCYRRCSARLRVGGLTRRSRRRRRPRPGRAGSTCAAPSATRKRTGGETAAPPHPAAAAAAPAARPAARRQRHHGALRPGAGPLRPRRRRSPAATSRCSPSAPASPASPAQLVGPTTPTSAVAAATAEVADWSGGTRLGDVLGAVQRPVGRRRPGPRRRSS